MKTEIKPCDCESPYQDARYGRGQRVHNMRPPKQKGEQPEWGCTVCAKGAKQKGK